MNINRRDFIRLSAVAAAMAAVPISLAKPKQPLISATGWAGLCDKVLVRDEFPDASIMARYTKDSRDTSYGSFYHYDFPCESIDIDGVIKRNKKFSENSGDEILVPTGHTVFKDSPNAIKNIKFVDDIVLMDILYNGPCKKLLKERIPLTYMAINTMFSEIEHNDLCVSTVCMNPKLYKMFRKINENVNKFALRFNPSVFDEDCGTYDEKKTGHVGLIWTADIYLSNLIYPTDMFVFAPSEYVGVNAIRIGPYKCGNNMIQESGKLIINPYGVSARRFK